ncbi:hypothetical protein IJG21_03310 [Candidatus Saccharibacteria bacterium]|nr:hypothetical protein [Candidatus Saccharibacteria bacterium]
MCVLFFVSFFQSLRDSDVATYLKMSSELLSVVPFHSPLMVKFASLSPEQTEAIRAIFLNHDVPASALASSEDVEEAFRTFYADYVHGAPN